MHIRFHLIILVLFCQHLSAQYTLNGSATQDACNLYTLTAASNTQSGSVWNNNKINLTQSFDFKFDVFLGNNDAGADGIVFVLQPISTSVGSTGGGLGYEGISPAVGVTIDTWQNTNNNDPAFDHIAIQLNGDINHISGNNIAGPVQAISGFDNIEDGQWHALRINWDVATKTLSAYVDGILRVSAVKDFVTDIFSGNALVYWGFTGSTGGANNLQRFKIALNPAFNFAAGQKRCIHEPITFYDSTVSFTAVAKFYWDFGDGSPLDSIHVNPVHTYAAGGDYSVKQKVIGADGCEATNTQIIRIGTKPIAGFKSNDNCIANPVVFSDTSKATVGTINNWYWDFGDATSSSLQNPSKTFPAPGDKIIKLAVKTFEGCESDTLTKLVHIYSVPTAGFIFTDSVCFGSPTYFFDRSMPNGDPVNNWTWTFSDSTGSLNTSNAVHYFKTPGQHAATFSVSANGTAACNAVISKNIYVIDKPVAYFTYNSICQSALVTFTDSSFSAGGVPVNQWWWKLNGGLTSVQNSISTIYFNSGTDTIQLVVRSGTGCFSDTLKKTVIINPKSVARFGISSPACAANNMQFSDSSVVNGSTITQWSWINNNTEWSTQKNAVKVFASGNQTVGLVATSALGCKSDTLYQSFYVSPIPGVTMSFKDACKNTAVDFTATDISGTVTQWKWIFGDGSMSTMQNTKHSYISNGNYNVKLLATAASGCYADTMQKNITIYGTDAFAGNDTIAASGQPVQLHASGGLSYTWSPANFLSDATSANPVTVLSASQTFTLKAFTPEGCESYDDVTVTIYKGPDIYLPNAFTPNGDTRNDVYRGIPVGLKQFNYLKIYNRWGQLVFYTTDLNRGWDGLWQGEQQGNGVYIVLAAGVDYNGNKIDRKQTVMLIR